VEDVGGKRGKFTMFPIQENKLAAMLEVNLSAGGKSKPGGRAIQADYQGQSKIKF
jgi:hypothetical protein